MTQSATGLKHFFSVDVAVSVGVHSAIIFENIAFWVMKNKTSKRNFHNGKYWTYGSIKHLSGLFDYLSEKQVRGALDKLITCGYIETGNFNRSAYDRTKWYTLTDKGESIALKQKNELPKRAIGYLENVKAIPDIKRSKDYINPFDF